MTFVFPFLIIVVYTSHIKSGRRKEWAAKRPPGVLVNFDAERDWVERAKSAQIQNGGKGTENERYKRY